MSDCFRRIAAARIPLGQQVKPTLYNPFVAGVDIGGRDRKPRSVQPAIERRALADLSP